MKITKKIWKIIWKTIKCLLKFNWMNKNFFIRIFLFDILIVVHYGIYKMFKSGKMNWDFLTLLWASSITLIGMLTVRKIIENKKGT